MTTFGMSAYMKLLALNPPPRDTAIRNRVRTTGANGYDFHKAMRKIVTEFSAGLVDWPKTKARLKSIKQAPERKSATAAAFALTRWVAGRPIRIPVGTELRSPSPNDVFTVRFTPDFEINLDGIQTSVHIWNTATPTLQLREALGALGLFVPENAPASMAVLSLRTGELFVPVDYKSTTDLARFLAIDIEKRFTRIARERADVPHKDRSNEKRLGR